MIQILKFTTHQRITGKESESESRFPEYSSEENQQGNNGETSEKQQESQEGNGREGNGKEGKEGDESLSSIQDSFSIEQKESFKKFNDWIKANAPRVSTMKEPFTIQQYLSIIKKGYDANRIQQLLADMHNWTDLHKKRVSAYLTLINWERREKT